MPEQNFKIGSIFGGWSNTDYFNLAGQFLSSLGIDPDMPSTDAGNKASGYIRPTSMAKFSGANVNAPVLNIVTNPKTALTYVVLTNGKIISYNASLAGETLVGTVTGSEAHGSAYYNNGLLVARKTDIARYGAINGTPSLTQSYWQGTLGLAALVDTVYPSINSIEIPNHQIHKHTDGAAYICNVLASNKGSLNKIKTSKTTVEGDLDAGSEADVLDFSWGEYPIQVETYQTDLAVILLEGFDSGAATSMMRGKLSFWDTTSDSFTQITSVETENEKEIFTAMRNVNGVLYVFSGFITGGCRISRVISGYQLDEIAYLPEEYPPVSAGAVDDIINRFVWGSNTVEPAVAGAVFSIGAKEKNLPMGLHSILRAPTTGDNPQVTAVKYVQSNGKIRQPIIGYKSDSEYGLAKISTTYGTNIIRGEVIIPDNMGSGFMLKQLKFPLAQAMAANMACTVKIYTDEASDNVSFTIDNSTQYSGKRYFIIQPQIPIVNNFFIEITFSGTVLMTIGLPLLGILETVKDPI